MVIVFASEGHFEPTPGLPRAMTQSRIRPERPPRRKTLWPFRVQDLENGFQFQGNLISGHEIQQVQLRLFSLAQVPTAEGYLAKLYQLVNLKSPLAPLYERG